MKKEVSNKNIDCGEIESFVHIREKWDDARDALIWILWTTYFFFSMGSACSPSNCWILTVY